jgi:hypothetical protein
LAADGKAAMANERQWLAHVKPMVESWSLASTTVLVLLRNRFQSNEASRSSKFCGTGKKLDAAGKLAFATRY